IAPDGRIFTAAVVDNDNAPFSYIIDEVANCPRWDTCGPIKKGKSAAGQMKSIVERFDAETLPGNAEAVKSIAKGRRIDFRCPLNILIHVCITSSTCFHNHHP